MDQIQWLEMLQSSNCILYVEQIRNRNDREIKRRQNMIDGIKREKVL